MSFAKPALICVAAALALSACGTINVKPTASATHSRGQIDDPRTTKNDHVDCLRANGVAVQEIGNDQLLLDGSIRVVFEPSPGAAQTKQIENDEQAAEVIGSALLYPGNAADAKLNTIEGCIAQGVKG